MIFAYDEQGKLRLADYGKQHKDQKFYSCFPIDSAKLVIPRVGEVNIPHWAHVNGDNNEREGSEMTYWHYMKQVDAQEQGLQVEYKVTYDLGVFYADAYDETTNTVIEYVNTCYDEYKVSKYWQLGYNQLWVFKDQKKSYKNCIFFRDWNLELQQKLNRVFLSKDRQLPTIRVVHEPE